MSLKNDLFYAGIGQTQYNRLKTSLQENNRQSLCIFSLVGFLGMACMLGASTFESSLVKNRALYGFMAFMYILIYFCARFIREKKFTRTAMYVFDLLLLFFGTVLGTWIDPENLSTAFTVVLFLVPLLFCDRAVYTMLVNTFGILGYFAAASLTQTPQMRAWNATNIIPFGALSILLTPYICRLKVDHSIIRTQRKTLKGLFPDAQESTGDQLRTVVSFVQVMMNYHTDESLLHCKRVRQYSKLLCHAYNHINKDQEDALLTDSEVQMIGVGAELHDIGKIYIPDHILQKKEQLTESEWEVVKNHTVVGAQLIDYVANICSVDSKILHNIICYHHERWDGAGYPEQLKGDAIPLEAQLVAIAEVYDSLTEENYSERRSHEEAYEMIVSGKCGLFSPQAIACFQTAKKDFLIIEENKEQKRWNLLEGVYANRGKGYWYVKRVFDIIASAGALIVLSPLLLAIAAWIKLDDPKSPVIFRQERLGRHKKPFMMYKFRTMVPNAEQMLKELAKVNEKDGPVFKIRKDPRITGPGHFLRKTSLDELPQLVNILKGDMTVVGPRPPLASEVEKYSRYHEMRLSVTPGLTCFWQAHDSRDDVPFEEWMDMDIAYIGTRSAMTDIKIIFKTVLAVLKGSGH